MNQQEISSYEFKTMMKSLNILNGDIVYVEANLSPDLYNPLFASYFINQLIEYIGEEGTIVMDLSGYNKNLNRVMANNDNKHYLTPYNKETSTLYAKSELAKFLSVKKDVKYSKNTFYPYIALGKYANLIVNGQSFDFPNGSNSPLARLYELRAKAILINHDIKSLLLNRHYIDISYNSSVSIGGGLVNDSYHSFLEKKFDEESVYSLFGSKKFKELFYYSNIKDLPMLGISIRDYIDFSLKHIEGQVWRKYY